MKHAIQGSFLPLSLAASVLLTTAAAQANTTVTFPDFTATSGASLALNGDATVGVTSTAGDTNTLQLVPTNVSFNFGTAFSQTPLQAASGFSTVFQFRMTDPAGISDGTEIGADGLVFTAQNVSSSAGAAGEGIGYQNIGSSVAVKFDTFQNGGNNDPSSNYIGIATDGDINNADYPGGQTIVPTDFDNGTIWTAWIDYDGTTLKAYAVDSATAGKPSTPLLSYALNIPSIIGSQTAFVGFTAAGGSASENTYILDWTYFDFFNPAGTSPEPASLSLLSIGAVGMFIRRRSPR